MILKSLIAFGVQRGNRMKVGQYYVKITWWMVLILHYQWVIYPQVNWYFDSTKVFELREILLYSIINSEFHTCNLVSSKAFTTCLINPLLMFHEFCHPSIYGTKHLFLYKKILADIKLDFLQLVVSWLEAVAFQELEDGNHLIYEYFAKKRVAW